MTAPICTLPPKGKAAAEAARNRATLPVLETERLTLRTPQMEDLKAWTAIFTSEESAAFGGPFTAQEAFQEFATYTAGWQLYGHGLFTVTRRADGTVLGFVPLGLEWGDQEPELGWMFLRAAHGQGYAQEAARAVRDWGFALLPTFVSYVDPENEASARVAERLGATRDAGAEAGFDHEVHIWRHRRPS